MRRGNIYKKGPFQNKSVEGRVYPFLKVNIAEKLITFANPYAFSKISASKVEG